MMTSTIHYRLKSTPNFDKVEFNGNNISLVDFKNLLFARTELLLQSGLFDITVLDERTLIKYESASDIIPAECYVTICRIPAKRGPEKLPASFPPKKTPAPIPTTINDEAETSANKTDGVIDKEVLEMANKNFLEECEKIRSFSQDLEYLNYYGKPIPTGKVPPNYICHRCGLPGHWIQNCPSIKIGPDGRPLRTENPVASQVKRSYGIPNSFLKPISDPNQLGAVLTRDGSYAVPAIDAEAYQKGKKERPPFLENSRSSDKHVESEPIPPELCCPLCSKLIDDAVVLPCCHEPVCDKCITDRLLSSEKHQCPLCEQTGVSPCQLLPNHFLRKKVKEYHSMTAKKRYLELISTNRPSEEISPHKRVSNVGKTVLTSNGTGQSTGISKEMVDSLISKDPSLSLPKAPMNAMNPMVYIPPQMPMMNFQYYPPFFQQPMQPYPRLLSKEEFYKLKETLTRSYAGNEAKEGSEESKRSDKRHKSSSRKRDRSRDSRRSEPSRNQLDRPSDHHSKKRHNRRSRSKSHDRRHKRRRHSSD